MAFPPGSWLLWTWLGGRLPLITNSGKSPPQACLGKHCQCFPLSFKVCVLGQEKPASRYLNWLEWKPRDQIAPYTHCQGQGRDRGLITESGCSCTPKLSLLSCHNPWNFVYFLFQTSGGVPHRTVMKGSGITAQWGALAFCVSFGWYHLQY